MVAKGEGPLGVIAGAGRFPFMVAGGAKRAGNRVVVVGLRGLADEALAADVDGFHWAGLAQLGRWIRILRRAGARRAVMAGFVHKQVMYGRFRLLKLLPDWTSFRLWFFHLRDKRNDTVLAAVADVLGAHGIVVEECVKYCPDDLAPSGVLAGPAPSAAQLRDLEFGWRMAKELGRLDIGQAVAVKETEVIAVEAIEGTDRMIERAGGLCPRGGWCLIKVAKPSQDLRFDVPTIGPDTVEALGRNGGCLLVVEAGKTVVIDRARTTALAEARGVTIVARSDP